MKIKKKIYLVTTMTPHRISFAGGGSDYPDFFNKYEGSVINATIDKYLFVTLKKHSKIYKENYRLMYSETEHCNKVSEIKNNIARECLKLVPVEVPITISTSSDLPPDSGTGSSSSFAIGLLNALHIFNGETPSPYQLAKEACKIEIDILKKNSGKQDQYAAAYGGFNNFIFKRDDEVLIRPINIYDTNLEKLFSNLILLWTDQTRDSSKIVKGYKFKTSRTINNLIKLKEFVNLFQNVLEKPKLNLKKLSFLMERSWKTKKNISSEISNKKLDTISSKLYNLGINGHRVIGAGGGGFFLCLANKSQQKILSNHFKKNVKIKVKIEPIGSRAISILYS